MPIIILKEEATEQGLKRYFTGKVCRNGHIEERRTSDGSCVGCTRLNSRKYHKTDKGKEARSRGQKKYKQKPSTKETIRKWRQSETGKKINARAQQLPGTKASRKKWRQSEKGKVSNNKTIKKYYEKYPERKIARNLRVSIKDTLQLQNTSKSKKFIDLTGCTNEKLISHIQKKFLKGMSWENYGFGNSKWHIDHIIPLDYFVKNFDLNDLYIQKIAFHFSNLQPLWQKDNISKNNRIDKKEAEKKIAKIKKLLETKQS